jgi:hypothetical protein
MEPPLSYRARNDERPHDPHRPVENRVPSVSLRPACRAGDRPTAIPGTGRPPGTASRSFDVFVSTALMTAVGPQQPGYLSHTDAAAAPIDRLTQRQTFLLGHRPQRLPSAPLSVPDESIAFTKRGQHGDRQTLESASRSARSLRSTAWATADSSHPPIDTGPFTQP